MLIDFYLNEQDLCIQGHFPGDPLAPGAWLLAKIDLIIREQLPTRKLSGFSKVKFMAPLRPGMSAQLSIEQLGLNRDDTVIASQVRVRITSDNILILDAKGLLE